MYSLTHVFITLTALWSIVCAKPKSTQCFTSLVDHPVAVVKATTSTSTPACTSPTVVTTTITKSTRGGTATLLYISTTTAPYSTVTVPTPAGFKGIEDTLKGAGYDGSAGSVPPQKRSQMKRAAALNRALKAPGAANKQYVAAVSCNEILAATQCTTTSTVTTVITTGAATTKTSSTTETFYASTTTLYPACASNNVANTWKGKVIGQVNGSLPPNANYTLTTTETAADCCEVIVSTITNSLLYAFIQNTTYAQQVGGNCAGYYAPSKCRGQKSLKLGVTVPDQGYGQFVLGNLICAEFVSGTSSTTATATPTA